MTSPAIHCISYNRNPKRGLTLGLPWAMRLSHTLTYTHIVSTGTLRVCVGGQICLSDSQVLIYKINFVKPTGVMYAKCTRMLRDDDTGWMVIFQWARVHTPWIYDLRDLLTLLEPTLHETRWLRWDQYLAMSRMLKEKLWWFRVSRQIC